MQNEKKIEKKADKEFQEVTGGHCDEMGFYFTPNGSTNKIFFHNNQIKRLLGSRWMPLQQRGLRQTR